MSGGAERDFRPLAFRLLHRCAQSIVENLGFRSVIVRIDLFDLPERRLVLGQTQAQFVDDHIAIAKQLDVERFVR